jgi:hypothetical protein
MFIIYHLYLYNLSTTVKLCFISPRFTAKLAYRQEFLQFRFPYVVITLLKWQTRILPSAMVIKDQTVNLLLGFCPDSLFGRRCVHYKQEQCVSLFPRPGNHMSAMFFCLLLSTCKVKYFLNCSKCEENFFYNYYFFSPLYFNISNITINIKKCIKKTFHFSSSLLGGFCLVPIPI